MALLGRDEYPRNKYTVLLHDVGASGTASDNGAEYAALAQHNTPRDRYAPILENTEYFKPWLYHTAMCFVPEHVLGSGLCVGEEYLASQPCLVSASYSRGAAVLYAFSPQFRAQTDGMFKVLFNALYLRCN